jgi:valyl-tRNA synthetase
VLVPQVRHLPEFPQVVQTKRKRKDEIERLLPGLEKKLSDSSYTTKAPEEVVEEERERLERLKAELAGIEDMLRSLGG